MKVTVGKSRCRVAVINNSWRCLNVFTGDEVLMKLIDAYKIFKAHEYYKNPVIYGVGPGGGGLSGTILSFGSVGMEQE